jgi:hypothetical protein
MRIRGIRLWRRSSPSSEEADPFARDEAAVQDAELREILLRYALRVAAAFAILFGLVFFVFWWSGAAVRFGAARAADRVTPTWRVSGTVRSAATRQPIPWAAVEDDANGRPPFYRTDAGYSGVFELLTLAEPHRVRVSAPGFHTMFIDIGRRWFLWLPEGRETLDVELQPD